MTKALIGVPVMKSWLCRLRVEAVRLAMRITTLDVEFKDTLMPARRTSSGASPLRETRETRIGPVTAAVVYTAWSHLGRVHSEASFAALAGVSPSQLHRGTASGTGLTEEATDPSTMHVTWPPPSERSTIPPPGLRTDSARRRLNFGPVLHQQGGGANFWAAPCASGPRRRASN